MKFEKLILVLTIASSAVAYCPNEMIHNTGNCSYRFHCIHDITGIRLPLQCLEASNDPVPVDVTLSEAIDIYDDGNTPMQSEYHNNQQFLSFITSLKISGHWPKTKLALLQFTMRLENLILSGNQIEKIEGQPFITLSNLEILDLSHNKLTDINNLFQFELPSNKLSKLYLSHNKIHDIKANAFSELTALTELDLSYNLISDLTVEPFSNLTSLEILKLNNNSIINLNGAVNYLQSLKHLYLRGNKIENIDVESLKTIIHLETFDMSSNHLARISSIMFSRHWKHLGSNAICKIILSGNHIISVPNATARETKRFLRYAVIGRGRRNSNDVFTEVDLSNNDIKTIEYNAFQSLVKLTSLNLSNNKLIEFQVNPDDVAFMRFLNLSGNHISHLYFDSFSSHSYPNLQTLDLSHNKLEYIPNRILNNNYYLNHVNTTHNSIKNFDTFRISMFHPEGGVLDLSKNGLTSLKIPYGEALRFTMLILHSNNITDIASVDLFYQTDLKNLDMSNNLIRELREHSLRLPVSLIILDLSCNRIENIAPSAFLTIAHLKTLRLAHNQLKTIEYGTFNGLSTLLNLDLSFNRLGFLDSRSLMDLKSLSVLSLRYNGIYVINDESWYGHKCDLKVILDGNNFTCEWLATALKNANNGYSKMKPSVLKGALGGNSLDGIPCTPGDAELANIRLESSKVMVDERLLMTTQKILEAVKEQTYYMRNFMWRVIQEDAEKMKSFS